jgi:hypothetical protein
VGVSDVNCLIANDKLAGEEIILATEGMDETNHLNDLTGAK